MTVKCARPSEIEEKKYHHNVAIAAVFDGIYGRLCFTAKTTQAEAKAPACECMGSEEGKLC